MLRSLKEVQADDSVVGFYQATTLGAFFNQSLVDTQAIHQDRLRHGGVVIVHGKKVSISLDISSLKFGRSVTNGTRKCIFPCFPAHQRILGCLQESKFQHDQVIDSLD